jgi:hypothetical protein
VCRDFHNISILCIFKTSYVEDKHNIILHFWISYSVLENDTCVGILMVHQLEVTMLRPTSDPVGSERS